MRYIEDMSDEEKIAYYEHKISTAKPSECLYGDVRSQEYVDRLRIYRHAIWQIKNPRASKVKEFVICVAILTIISIPLAFLLAFLFPLW